MSKLNDFIEKLEVNVQKLFQKIDEQKALNKSLEDQIVSLKQQVDVLTKNNESLKVQNHTLKLTHTLSGSEDYKKETKQKINSLIKEIDHCISQLSS